MQSLASILVNVQPKLSTNSPSYKNIKRPIVNIYERNFTALFTCNNYVAPII